LILYRPKLPPSTVLELRRLSRKLLRKTPRLRMTRLAIYLHTRSPAQRMRKPKKLATSMATGSPRSTIPTRSARFLRDHVDWNDELAVKAASLRDAYKNMLATAHPHYPAPIAAQIGALLKKIGVAKETRPDGVYYLGLAPKAAQTREAAE
jgi:hypothetical protein